MTTTSIQQHYQEASRATVFGLVVMAALAVGKVLIGWWGGSEALIADGFHTVSDFGTSMVVLVGLYFARRPPDRMHPYGHGRAEGIAACMVGIVLLGVVFVIAWNAIGELRSAEPKARPHWLVPVLALTSIVVNEVLYQYKRRVSARTSSQAVSAEGWHHRSDAFSSIPVLIGTSAAVIGGGRWTLLDPLAALVVAGFILVAAIAVLRETWPEMLDASVSEETISRLKDVARAVPGVLDVEATRGRRSGLGLLVELHVEVAPSASVEEGHRVAQRVRDALLTSEERVADAVIHIEPYYANDH